MAAKDKYRKRGHSVSFIPSLQPLSIEEKKELELRIFVAICQSAAMN